MTQPGVPLIDQDHYASQGPPHAAFRRLRAEAPVSWRERPDDEPFWAITKYKDVFAVSLDQKTFSSARRGAIFRPWNEEDYQAQQGMLINQDPPGHTKYRKLVSLGFSGRMLAAEVVRVWQLPAVDPARRDAIVRLEEEHMSRRR